MSDWLAAFEGIAAYPTVGGGPDLAEVLAPRVRRALPRDGGVIIHHGALKLLAERIVSQSEEIARLSGAADAIDADRLAAYEREQAAVAEWQAAHTGVIVQDSGTGALYDRDGALKRHDDSYITLLTWCKDNDWTVTSVDMEGVLGDNGTWPLDIVEVQKAFGALLREKRAAEVAAALATDPAVSA